MILKSFLIVFGCLFLGQIFIYFTKLPLPPSIIGLLLLFTALQTGVVKLADVQMLAKTLLDYLVLMVVPACISIMQYLDIIWADLWVLILATSLSTVMVLLVNGKIYEWIRNWQKSNQARTDIGEG